MGIRIGGGEELNSFGKSDAVSGNVLVNQKPSMSSSLPLLVSSSSISSTASESVMDPLKLTYGEISQSNGEKEDEEFEWVDVDGETDVRTDKAPEIDEVDDAFSALQLMFNEDDGEESEEQVSDLELVDWIEPPLELCNARTLQPYMLDRLYDAFHLFQTDPSVQRMVMSLTSDRAVWDAVMNNEVVRELITNAEKSKDSGSAANCIRKLFERSATKIIHVMERLTKYVNYFLNVEVPGDETVVLATGAAPVMKKLQMTVLLAIVVLFIVVVTRVKNAR